MSDPITIGDAVERDIWAWINEFVTVPHKFYDFKFAPCPYARKAVLDATVDVVAWRDGDVCQFIRAQAEGLRDQPGLTTRVLAFPPRIQLQWGISEFVDSLNAELIPDNIFLNPGLAKTTVSRFPGSAAVAPYFIVVANRLDAVLAGAEMLKRTNYYQEWPQAHRELVVERRERLTRRYGKQ